MSEIEKYYNGEIIVDFEEETELEKNYNKVAELYSKAVKKKIEYRKEIERLNNIINELEKYIEEDDWTSVNTEIAVRLIKLKLQELKGSDKE